MSDNATSSVIHDIGYQRYTGVRLGRGYAWLTLYVHALRTAFGLGRSAKAKIFPWLVCGIMLLVAVIAAAVRAQLETVVLGYLDLPENLSVLVLIFLAVVAPELVSRDLRAGVMPLYFSRPIRSRDYVFAKLAALASAVWLLLAVPMLVMFAVAAFGAPDLAAVGTEAKSLGQGLAYALIDAALFAPIALLVASLTGKRAFAAAGIVAVFLFTTPIVGVLVVVGGTVMKQLALLASPTTMVGGVRVWLFDDDPSSVIGGYGPAYAITAAALSCACVLLVLLRYRRVSR